MAEEPYQLMTTLHLRRRSSFLANGFYLEASILYSKKMNFLYAVSALAGMLLFAECVNNMVGINNNNIHVRNGQMNVLSKMYESLVANENKFVPKMLNMKHPKNEPSYLQAMHEQGALIDLEIGVLLARDQHVRPERLLKYLAATYGVTSYYSEFACLGKAAPAFPKSVYALNSNTLKELARTTNLKCSALAEYRMSGCLASY